MDDLASRLATDPAVGRAVVFDVLARGPRIKPSRSLLIDPSDTVWRLWQARVVAAATLLASPAVEPVVDELFDELAVSPELAADVAALARPWPGLTPEQHERFARLSAPASG
ncbi:MAG: hypothetical protein ACTHMS_18925 [Jatrophihabitans sp.]|uniref:hypothetical protein n=1 Tax=Jatrophihabitans sp. TaxID=1932789 RepID=UPI003F7CFA38